MLQMSERLFAGTVRHEQAFAVKPLDWIIHAAIIRMGVTPTSGRS